jgi:N-methylhydantoinase A
LRSVGLVEKVKTARAHRSSRTPEKAQAHTMALVQFASGAARAAVYRREELKAGQRLRSPCIVTEYSATTLVPPGARARLDQFENLIIEP